ncbi:Ankyrin-1 [Fusarium oxysporum f. sp. cubense race 1]|uniref:Ankyrin-1 n=1 Tax=Fusarium oxysporum f. sp. cubense (strain race 1) TaxID=1229664 RepID=N4UGM6_FUSC1|nr:Ankyrin-1 [Fusarium oxysporum f. sp. cubense race 1]
MAHPILGNQYQAEGSCKQYNATRDQHNHNYLVTHNHYSDRKHTPDSLDGKAKVHKEDHMACVFFYFSHCDANQPSVAKLWAALLEQLIQQIDTYDNIAPGLHSRFYQSLAGDFVYPTAYASLFHQQASMFKTVYVVIDALDLCAEYCDDATTQTISQTFAELPQNVRVLFSCSNSFQAKNFGAQQNIQVRPNPADVEAYVRSRVGHSVKLQHLQQDNQEMESLVKTIVDQTRESDISPASVRNIHNIPLNLSEIFELSCQKIKSSAPADISLAKHVFTWVIYARDDITIDHVLQSFAVSTRVHRQYQELYPDLESLLRVCDNLVTLDNQESTLRLIHESVRVCISRNGLLAKQPDSEVARTCLECLLSKDTSDVNNRLFSYSATFWALHLQSVNIPDCKELEDLAMKFLCNTAQLNKTLNFIRQKDHERSFDGMTGLHAAAYFDLPQWVQGLVRSSIRINSSCSDGETALHWAVSYGRLNVVRQLLEHCADPNIGDSIKETPLHKLSTGPPGTRFEIAEALINRGAKVTIRNNKGFSPVSLAIRFGPTSIASLFISSQKDVNTEFESGWSFLREVFYHGHGVAESLDHDKKSPGSMARHRAVKRHLDCLVDLLLDMGVTLDQPTSDGWLPVIHASKHGSVLMLRKLLEYQPNSNLVNKRKTHNGKSPLRWALEYERWNTAQILVHHGANVNEVNKDGWNPLIHVTKSNQYEMVHFLVQKEALVNSTDNDGLSALSHAVSNRNKDISWLLIMKGALVNIPAQNSLSNIEKALQDKDLSIAWLLCMHHADLEQTDDKGMTLLHRASREGSLRNVTFLLDRGMTIGTADHGGLTPLHHAVLRQSKEVVELLTSRNTGSRFLDRPDKNGCTALVLATRKINITIVQILLRHGSSCELKDRKGMTAIHYAASLGFREALQAFSPRVKDINLTDNMNNTAIHHGVLGGRANIVRFLAERKADLEVLNAEGCSALILAVLKDNPETVRELVRVGANIYTIGRNGCSAMDFAEHQGNYKSRRVLMEALQPG